MLYEVITVLVGGRLLALLLGTSLLRLLTRGLALRGRGILVAALVAALLRTLAARAVQPLHSAPIRLHHDLGGVAVLAVLVLPLAGLERPFDVDQPSLAQIVGAEFA